MKIKLAIGVLLLVVVLVVAITLLTVGDDEDDGPTTAQERSGGGGDDDDDGDEGDDGDAPSLRTVAVERAEGKNAVVAAASPQEEQPKEFWLRVSAAPKQRVKGSWNIDCRPKGNSLDTYDVTPPHEMKLTIPTKNAKSCIAGATAQLSGEGRVRVTILRDR